MANLYQPSEKDRQRLQKKAEMFKVSGDKVFATLQGEGLPENEGGTVGCPAVFLRLHFCNLKCGLTGGWKCDTGYTWDTNRSEYWQEPEDWSIDQTKEEIVGSWQYKFGNLPPQKRRLVITGGEPLLQQELIVKLLRKLSNWNVEIETNGTIRPLSTLRNYQFNCSPKLANSGNDLSNRYKPEVLKYLSQLPNVWFKFVVNDKNDLKEVGKIINDCDLPKEKILIMPEGWTIETVENNQKKIMADVERKDWKLIQRNQLIWFGSKRRT